jgi:hypothetical protein
MNSTCIHPGPLLRACRWARGAGIVCAVIIALLAPDSAQARMRDWIGGLRVMTYNVDEGTDFTELTTATTEGQFLIAVGDTITQVRATQPASRMKAVARQILLAAPTAVSLQEVAHWSSGSFDPATQSCGPVSTEFDMLQELLDALGHAYSLAYQGVEYDFPSLPGLILPSTFLCVQLQNYVVILVRNDSKLTWSNAQSGQYTNATSVTTPLGQFVLPRAWVSIDANFYGIGFRLIGTHLESVDPNIRRLQAGELRAGPANTFLPVVIAMDSNAQAWPLPQDPTYTDFVAAGYRDAWLDMFPWRPGYTCCQAPTLDNKLSELSQRIDLILTRGNIRSQSAVLFGILPTGKTLEGLWPSDHAGVAAQLAQYRW